jgi:putative transposase
MVSLNQFYQGIGISKQAVHKLVATYRSNKEEELQMLKVIYEIRDDHPTMGMRDLYYKIKPATVGRDAFESFCKSHDLWSVKPKNYRRTTDSTGVVRFDDLLKNLTITSINQAWQSDITYYELNDRYYYITFIIDSYSRRIIGHYTSDRLTTDQTTLAALQMAIKTRNKNNIKGLVFHSDGGGQYYSKDFLALTKSLEFKNSMCELAWENGKAERINGVIKNNYLKHRSITTYDQLKAEVDRSVLLYNTDKPHIRLNRKSPINFENELVILQQQTRPTMNESLEAIAQIYGASSPGKSEQTRPQNQDVLNATNLIE